jgi:hypothetical protein
MKYLPLVILAVLVMAFIIGCASRGTVTQDITSGNSQQAAVQQSDVVTQATAQVDSAIIDDSEEVQIGEMI